jgi:hypothetical protein
MVLTRAEWYHVVELSLAMVGTEHLHWHEGGGDNITYYSRAYNFLLDKVMNDLECKDIHTVADFLTLALDCFHNTRRV